MINRSNWKCVKGYLAEREEIDQVSVGTLKLDASLLRHLLEWADDVSFREAPMIRPGLTEYLKRARLDGRDKSISKVYATKIVRTAKRFFIWLRTSRRGYSSISLAWLNTLKVPRSTTDQQEFKAVTIEEIHRMAKAPATLLWEKRIKAAAIFMFLSGIRVGAFVSLPLLAVDLQKRTVKQWPSLGVRTKFRKRATTYLLEIPGLNEVVEEWDELVRRKGPENGYWFAHFNTLVGGFDAVVKSAGKYRYVRVRKDLQRWLESVDLPYRSPHQFRHGHAVYALKQAQDVADLKAVSMNLMHSNLSITDGVYGILSQQDISKRIQGLGKSITSMQSEESQDLRAQLARLEQLMLFAIEKSSFQPSAEDPSSITIPTYLLDRLSDGQPLHLPEQSPGNVEPYPNYYDQEGAAA